MNEPIEVDRSTEDEERWVFRTTLNEEQGRSTHTITLARRDYERLGSRAASPEDFVRTCLELLLRHESQDALMPEMDLREMISYYPEFEDEVRRRFGAPGATT